MGGKLNMPKIIQDNNVEEIVVPEPTDDVISEQDLIEDVDTQFDKEIDEFLGSVEEDKGEPAPEEEPPKEPSVKAKPHTKEEKSDYKWAEYKRNNKALKAEVERLKAEQEARDAYYKKQGELSGRTEIKSEKDFRNKLIESEQIALMVEAYGITEKQAESRLRLEKLNKPAPVVQPKPSQPTVDPVYEAKLNDEVSELNEAYGTKLGSYTDIVKLPNAEKMIRVLQADSSLSILDGYEIANRGTVQKKITKSTKQETLNNLNGYNHVKDVAGTSTINPHSVTREELKIWSGFNPGKSLKQVRQMIIDYKKDNPDG